MFKLTDLHAPNHNLLLDALSKEEYERFVPQLELVKLAKGKIIYNAGDTAWHAYFPLNGMLSLLHIAEDGSTIEVAMVGNEGMVGFTAIVEDSRIPYQVMAQSSVYAMKVNKISLDREFRLGKGLHDLLLHYIHTLLAQVSQMAFCCHSHTVKQRLCHLLLVCQDHLKSDTLFFTHEALAHLLGVSRTRVTMNASEIQREKLISCQRGKITILNTRGLKATACECYHIITKGDKLLDAA